MSVILRTVFDFFFVIYLLVNYNGMHDIWKIEKISGGSKSFNVFPYTW